MDIPKLIDTAEPFFFPGGPTGCLLVHGFTGTPKEMRTLGEHLNAQGHTVLGVRLTGHASRPEDMVHTRWEDWFLCVEDGWHLLSGCTERIFVIGLSMGGALSLTFASVYPAAGVVAMATPYRLTDPRLPFIRPISLFIRFQQKGPPDWHDPEAGATHTSYPSNPTHSAAELRDLLVLMRARLPEVQVPALLIYSKNDQSIRVDDRHAEQILAGLGSRSKQIIWVENSSHIITRDAAREDVFAAVDAFIDRTTQGDA